MYADLTSTPRDREAVSVKTPGLRNKKNKEHVCMHPQVWLYHQSPAYIDVISIFRNSTDREVSLMILMAYLSYILAEVFGLSGILTVFFCGIVMSHYAWHNVTMNSQVTTKHAFATMSFIAEIFIFMYVGMDSLDMGKWRFVNDR
ncbi:sodium/hydrogen exchanger 2-like [Cynara cardunculus var. scolymus]|uniref:sodium/hydrogen exchanger 2-like n=1 Tax=Cynara cardunculus var. scolymus TaxID=59895 RepID=UPI000D62C64B|nr:sodium/hydrogen exchanger 2-like [Cynara cardunculus var. scolymus]